MHNKLACRYKLQVLYCKIPKCSALMGFEPVERKGYSGTFSRPFGDFWDKGAYGIADGRGDVLALATTMPSDSAKKALKFRRQTPNIGARANNKIYLQLIAETAPP